MALSDQQWLFLQDVARLIHFAELKDFKLTGGELYRPQAMQLLYYHGKTLKMIGLALSLIGAKKLSKTLNSYHGKRLAIDFNIFYDVDGDGDKDFNVPKAKSQVLGDYWESLSPQNRWGGNWNGGWDTPHFERRVT